MSLPFGAKTMIRSFLCGSALRSLALMFVVMRAVAQDQQPGRAKIGVALEGGGALGLAHIGVLEWFEEHHIPIDYIAGTSMGGLVGGLYATGLKPAELREVVS